MKEFFKCLGIAVLVFIGMSFLYVLYVIDLDDFPSIWAVIMAMKFIAVLSIITGFVWMLRH